MPCTISWTAWSDATVRRLNLAFIIGFLGTRLLAAAPTCDARLRLVPNLSTKQMSDGLLRAVLTTEQEYLVHCPNPDVRASVIELKRAYLAGLGVKLSKLPPTELDPLFRGLITIEERAEPLRAKLRNKAAPRSALPFLKQVFGAARILKGAVVLGGTGPQAVELTGFVDEICVNVADCPFWNSLVIYKVVLAKENGIAAYIGETGELVLSRSLIEGKNLLHRIVLLHELTHVAERFAWLKGGLNWVEEFQAFSGWQKSSTGAVTAKVQKASETRDDELTRLSRKSAFSILPDNVYLGLPGFDGFVLGKAFEESMAQKNASEDLADHVAVFRLFPERYCLAGKPIAPRKWAWISERVFGEKREIECRPASAPR